MGEKGLFSTDNGKLLEVFKYQYYDTSGVGGEVMSNV